MTASVFFVGCTVSQASAAAALKGSALHAGGSSTGLKAQTRIALALRGPIESADPDGTELS